MKHTVIINQKPRRSGKESIPDGAIAGNGDLAVILGNSESGLRLFVAKNDIWVGCEKNTAANEAGGIKPIGYIDFYVPEELYSSYYAEQRMDNGELYLKFQNGEQKTEFLIQVCALENIVMIEHSSNDNSLLKEPDYHVFKDCGENKEFSYKDIKAVSRLFEKSEKTNVLFTTAVCSGIRAVSESNGRKRYAVSASTNHDRDDYKTYGFEKILTFDDVKFNKYKKAHYQWWKEFFSKSSFELSDETLEMNWYASQYFLAVCSRNKNFAPGIFGNFITVSNPGWRGDYHLNYNYEAPFYALASSNHIELMDCYMTPLEEYTQRGREFAKRLLKCDGVYYPTGIMPKGLCSEYDTGNKYLNERLFLGQKSNASYACVVPVMRWYAQRDTEYAGEHIYPFLKSVGDFWLSYLKLENGRYVIYKDSIQEVPYFSADFDPEKHQKEINAFNSVLSLGLIRMVMRALIDMSEALSKDRKMREKWQDVIDNLSDYPTCRKGLKKVFRYTEYGVKWNNTNFLCLQHCYPAGQIGLSSDKELLKIAKNTFSANNRWYDDNATNSVFPCAARLGIEPKLIIKHLKNNFKKFLLPNCLFLHNGGCLENCSLTAGTLNEMALQSYDGKIRFFPDWDEEIDCKFKNLRANGAFLVSAEYKAGRIENIKLLSEKGCRLTFVNPFEVCVVKVHGSEKDIEDNIITMPTEPGDIIELSRV